MSVEALAIVLHHSRAKGTEKVVLFGIANHEGDGGSYPGVKTLAKYANVDVRTVQRAINHLSLPVGEYCVEKVCCPRSKPGLGELKVERQQGGDRDTPEHLRTNRYTILVRCPKDCDGTSQHRSKTLSTGRAPKAADRVTQMSPGDTDVTRAGDTDVIPPGDTDVTQTVPMNRPNNRPTPSPASATGPRAKCRQEISKSRIAATAGASADA